MEEARQGRNGPIVAARSATRRDIPYYCACCRVRVHLRRGRVREPHFAHNPGEGTEACELFRSVETGEGGGEGTRHEPTRPSLLLAIDPVQNWSLYLVVPEVPAEQLGILPVTALRQAKMAVKAGADHLRELSGMQFRPGVASVRVVVPAATHQYQVTAAEGWPIAVERKHLGGMAPGLAPDLNVFSVQGADWVRRSRDTDLYWGSEAVLLSALDRVPPRKLAPKELEPTVHGRVTWRAWRVVVPRERNRNLETWFGGFGFRVVGRPWHAAVRSAPMRIDHESGLMVLRKGSKVVVELVAPFPGGETPAVATDGASVLNWQAKASSSGSSDVCAIGCSVVGECSVSADEDGTGSASFLVEPRPSLASLKEALAKLPLLDVSVGDQRGRGWATVSIPRSYGKADFPTAEIKLGQHESQLVVAIVWTTDKAHVRRERQSAAEAALAVTEALRRPGLKEVVIDAGPMGRVTIRPVAVAVSSRQSAQLDSRTMVRLIAQAHPASAGVFGRPAWVERQLSDLRRHAPELAPRPLSEPNYIGWAARLRAESKN